MDAQTSPARAVGVRTGPGPKVSGPGPGPDGWSVGLDIGGTKTLGVLLTPDGTPGPAVRLRTTRGGEAVVSTAADVVVRLLMEADLRPQHLRGIGVGLPGVVDPTAGRVQHAVNLGIDEDLALADAIADAVAARTGDTAPVPVHVENDLNAAALGAAHLIGGNRPDLAFLALGTGLAAGLVLDGQLRRGFGGAAGEIGHLVLVPDGRPCGCGQRGCLEKYASGSAISAVWPGPGDRPAPVALFEAAAAGDPAAVAARDEFGSAVAAAVRVLLLTCDVEQVVIGGGVSALGGPLLDLVREQLDHAAAGSPFLASMRMAERTDLAPHNVPVGAVGAALVGRK